MIDVRINTVLSVIGGKAGRMTRTCASGKPIPRIMTRASYIGMSCFFIKVIIVIFVIL